MDELRNYETRPDYSENHLSEPVLVDFLQSPLPGFDVRPYYVTAWAWDIGESRGAIKDHLQA